MLSFINKSTLYNITLNKKDYIQFLYVILEYPYFLPGIYVEY